VWPIPTAYLVAAGILGIGMPALDRALGDTVPAEFGVGAAQAMLGAFATGLITVMGFIISVVIAGLTFGSTSVTPRIVRELQRNTTIRHVFGLLLLSVVYAFLVLNRVAPPNDPNFVPDLAVWLVTPLLIIDVAALFLLVREMGHSLRLVEIIDKVHRRAQQVIATMYRDQPAANDADNDDPRVTNLDGAYEVTIYNLDRSGVVANLDVARLVTEAARLNTTIELACPIGSYVPTGRPMLRVSNRLSDADEQHLRRAITLSDERTIDQDPLYALRLLVDIATRALSPAVNDPTTAVQVLDRIETILSVLATRALDRGTLRDREGNVRLVVPLPSWEEFVTVGLTEIRQYGATSLQVMRRLRALLEDLLREAPARRRPALEAELALLDQTVERCYPDRSERELAFVVDRHGLGEPGAAPRTYPASAGQHRSSIDQHSRNES
jgi:uncharacterized membrane protein